MTDEPTDEDLKKNNKDEEKEFTDPEASFDQTSGTRPKLKPKRSFKLSKNCFLD
jgi:hypothetical protein